MNMAALALPGPVTTMVEIHSLDPWWIARYQPQRKNTAISSLTREGFECWYPTYRSFQQMPLRKIPPKKRHMARQFMVEKRSERMPGYLFIRRATGRYDVNRLFDLQGCGSVVTNSGVPARVADHDIEIMRLAESDGTFDELQDHSRYRIAPLDPKALKCWSGNSQLDGRLDETGKMVLKVEAFGRIAKLLALADPV
jgi:hypothetical protein